MRLPKPKKIIAPKCVAGLSLFKRKRVKIKLSANESALGPSPKAIKEYKGKYLSLIIENKYGVTGEEFGHYESDYQLFYNSVPPYYCGMAYKITTVNVLKDFKTDSPLPPPSADNGP